MTTRTQGKTTGTVRHTSVRGSTRQTGAELRALGWLCRHPLFALLPLLAVLAVRTWGAVAVGYGAGRAGGGAAGVVAGAPGLVRPVGRPPHPLGLAALDGLPRPALGRAARRVRAHPRPPPHRPTLCPAGAAGPLA